MSVPAQVPISGPYIANGVTTQFAYKFYLLFATDMQVFVGGLKKTLNTDYTVTGVGNSQGGNVVFTIAPANGLEVLIKRATPYTRQTDYADNGDLLADVVNDDFDRIWLALQEINANFSSSISKAVGGNWDAQSLRIMAVADGTQPQDAATVNQLNNVNESAGQSAQAAANSAAAAKTSETNSASSQQAAASSASAASVSAGNSSDSANLAQKWAANPVGTEVTAGKYSAFHYASKAGDSATAAATSATNAATSATNASNSAAAAANSAASAKSDADRAQTANPDNQLKKANNLSDVADKDTAWKNLAKYGTAANTAAQGNDIRLGTVDQKTGGMISSAVSVQMTSSDDFSFPLTLRRSQFIAAQNVWFGGGIKFQFRADLANEGVDMYAQRNSNGERLFYQRTFNGDGSVASVYSFSSNGNYNAYNGAFINGSDERIKYDINVVDNPLEKMKLLKGVTYRLKSNNSFGMGYIAQDVEAVWPDAVSHSGFDQTMPDGSVVTDVKGISAGNIAAALHHEAILALMAKIEALEEKLNSGTSSQ